MNEFFILLALWGVIVMMVYLVAFILLILFLMPESSLRAGMIDLGRGVVQMLVSVWAGMCRLNAVPMYRWSEEQNEFGCLGMMVWFLGFLAIMLLIFGR